MAKPPTLTTNETDKPIRLTITVSPEVHAAFSRMAAATKLPIGRCMGEWLADTLEGVEFITSQLEKAREAPRQVVAEMRQWALGAVDQADEILLNLRKGKAIGAAAKGLGGDPAAGPGPGPQPTQGTPRPVIRGGKSSKNVSKGHRP